MNDNDLEEMLAAASSSSSKARPVLHVVRTVVLFLGMFFHFILVNCVPRSEALRDLPDDLPSRYDEFEKGLWMTAVGSGIVGSCTIILIGLVLVGMRRNKVIFIASCLAIVLYLLGALLNMIGFGIVTHEAWDWEWLYISKSAWRAERIGMLMGEACYTVAGLLMLFPEFEMLKDWFTTRKGRMTFIGVRGRPMGHVLRSAVLLLGIFFHFLLAACIPRAKRIDSLPDNSYFDDAIRGLYMTSAGAGVVEACAVLLLFLTLWGVRTSLVLKVAGAALLFLFVAGTLLNTIGFGIMTRESWDWTWTDLTQAGWRSELVGYLMCEPCYAICGLLVLLPDFGVLNTWG